MFRKSAPALAALFILSGCAATIDEQHLFAAYSRDAADKKKPTNFFKLTVSGTSGFSNARYLAGFYDERAIDLFMNELKAPTNQKLFDEKIAPPGDAQDYKPLSPTTTNGAYVLILSTNADAVANAIGSFAESQVVAQALTQLANKDRFVEKARSDVDVNVNASRARVMLAKLRGHLDEARNAPNASEARVAYTRALHALSQALGNREPMFKNFADAKRWFDLELAQPGRTP